MLTSLPAKPIRLHPRSNKGHNGGKDSKVWFCHNSLSEGIWATLAVLISSRHNGPAFIAVKTSKLAANNVPTTATRVSASSFNDRCRDVLW